MDNELFNQFIEKFERIVYNLRGINKNPEYFTLVAFGANGEKKDLIAKSERVEPKKIKKRVLTLVSLHNSNVPVKGITLEIFDSNNKSLNLSKFTFENIEQKPQANDNPLNGLSGPEIQSYISSQVQKQLDEAAKQQRIERMQQENEELKKLKEENEKTIAELEQEVEELQNKIEVKNTIGATAGMVGTLLESIGIPREVVGSKLGHLMGVSADDVQAAAAKKRAEENQEPIDENNEQTPQEKAIETINEYLYSLDNNQLSEIFIIVGACSDHAEAKQKILEIAKQYIPKN